MSKVPYALPRPQPRARTSTPGARARLGRRLLLGALAALSGCGLARQAEGTLPGTVGPRADVYVRPVGSGDREVVMRLESAALRDTSGGRVDLVLRRGELSSSSTGESVLLAGGPVPAATYDALVLRVAAARLVRAGHTIDLELRSVAGALPDPLTGEPRPEPGAVEYVVPLEASASGRDAVTLFFDWDADGSVEGDSSFVPLLRSARDEREVQLGRLYVTDEGAGTVVVVNRRSGQVEGTIAVGAGPRDLAVSRDLRQAFVANARDGSLSVLDLRLRRAVSTIPIQLGAQTWDVAVVDARTVVTANRARDTVSFFDVSLPARVTDVRVGRGPLRLAVSERQRRVYVINSLSNDVSVIDPSSLSVVASVPVEARPTDIAVDRRGREVYVSHRISSNLLVIDAAELTVVESIYVGGDATALATDRRRSRIFVACENPDELVVVDRELGSVIRRVPLPGPVVSLDQPIDGQWIYGASPELGGVVPIDQVRGATAPLVPCGQSPTGVVFAD